MSGVEQHRAEQSRDGFVVWRTEAAIVGANIVELSDVPLDRLQGWTCPCCNECKAIFAQDDEGRVWFGSTVSARGDDRVVVRIDRREEISQLVREHPCVPDRFLIAVWLAQGLYDELARLFGS